MDGNLLSRARDRLAEIRRENEKETERRRMEAQSRAPELRELGKKQLRLMQELFSATLDKEDGAATVAHVEALSLDIMTRRAELLVESGFPVEYLDDVVSCAECRDKGYIDGRVCACLRALYDQEQAKALSLLLKLGDEAFENFDLSYYDDTPSGALSPRNCMKAVYEYSRDYSAGFSAGSPSLLFAGGTGLGKTFLSACIARVVSQRGFSVVYDTAIGAFEPFEIQKFARYDAGDDVVSRIRSILECDLFILDDLGTEMATSFSVSALYTIVNTRLLAGKASIINTNLSTAELRSRYGQQTASRLEGEYRLLRFVGNDIRIQKRDRGLE